MNATELQRELHIHGVVSVIRREEVAVQTCCFCGNEKSNLELNAAKSIFHCWTCKRGGALGEVLEMLTGQHYNLPRPVRGQREQQLQRAASAALAQQNKELRVLPLSDVPSAALYVERRGIPLSRAAGYGMGICMQEAKDEQGREHPLKHRIVIPMYSFWEGELLGWVGRNYTGGRPKYLSTLPAGASTMTGWRMRSVAAVPIVVVEGPFDGIAVHGAGVDAAVLTGSGMSTEALSEWAGRITSQTPAVVVFLDADAAPRSKKIYWQLQAVCSVPVLEMRSPEGQDPAQLGSEWIARELAIQISALGGTVQGQP